MTEEKFAKIKCYKIIGKHIRPKITDLVVCLGCSLNY